MYAVYETVRDSTTKKPSKLGTGRQRAISNALHFINWHRFTLDVWPINKLVTTHTARVPVILACCSVCFLQVLRCVLTRRRVTFICIAILHIAIFVTDSPTPSHVRERDHRDGDRDGLGRTVRTRDGLCRSDGHRGRRACVAPPCTRCAPTG